MARAISTKSPVRQFRSGTPPSAPQSRSLDWTVLGLASAACAVLLPLVAPVILAAWLALIAWPLQQRAVRTLRSRAASAALLTGLLVCAFLIPIAVSVLSLSSAAVELAQRVQHSKSLAEGLQVLSSGNGGGLDFSSLKPQQLADWARQHGARALGAGRVFFSALSAVVIAIVVFLASFYTLLIEGEAARDWFIDRSPLKRGHTQRLANVFVEVGRGILIGTGLTALLQGAIATVGYFVTGVPQALVLGLLTVLASLVPSVGAALVWVPVTVSLFVSGRTGAGVAMLVIGCLVSTSDNLVRPFLARSANLRMQPLVLFVSMLSGIVVFGAWGLLFGPLVVRLAIEGLTLLKEEREAEAEHLVRAKPGA